MRNSNFRYIAKTVFGEVQGLKYTKKNLKIALESDEYKIFDSSLHGYKFIEKKDGKLVCSYYDYKYNCYQNVCMTIEEFWKTNLSKKRYILLLKLPDKDQ